MNVKQELGHILQREPPQRSELANIAMDEIANGLKKLAALGYPYKIVPATALTGAEYPKVLNRGHETLIVESAEEEKAARGDKWDDPEGLKASRAAAEKKKSPPNAEVAREETAAKGPTVKKVEPAGGSGAVKEAGPKGANIAPGNA